MHTVCLACIQQIQGDGMQGILLYVFRGNAQRVVVMVDDFLK
jgi:hypothetical protein